MAGKMGFVFDGSAPQAPNIYPPTPAAYAPVSPAQTNPFHSTHAHTPPYQPVAYSTSTYAQPPYPPTPYSTSTYAQPHPAGPYSTSSYAPGHSHQATSYAPSSSTSYAPNPHIVTHSVYTGQQVTLSGGQGQQSGNGIPGGKLGVLGGAAAAGGATAMAMKFLPKKLKSNKLVKYGLPLAGAGAAGHKLNQMNNQGGKY